VPTGRPHLPLVARFCRVAGVDVLHVDALT
jgi:hypothetical protein